MAGIWDGSLRALIISCTPATKAAEDAETSVTPDPAAAEGAEAATDEEEADAVAAAAFPDLIASAQSRKAAAKSLFFERTAKGCKKHYEWQVPCG
jgi:hypothetical protein